MSLEVLIMLRNLCSTILDWLSKLNFCLEAPRSFSFCLNTTGDIILISCDLSAPILLLAAFPFNLLILLFKYCSYLTFDLFADLRGPFLILGVYGATSIKEFCLSAVFSRDGLLSLCAVRLYLISEFRLLFVVVEVFYLFLRDKLIGLFYLLRMLFWDTNFLLLPVPVACDWSPIVFAPLVPYFGLVAYLLEFTTVVDLSAFSIIAALWFNDETF